MSSIPRCEAASISTTSIEVPFVIETQALQVLSGVARRALRAVQRLREDPRHRGLAGAARPGEEVGLAYLSARDRVAQRPDDRVLPDHLVEVLGPVLPVEGGHCLDSSRIAGQCRCSSLRAGSRSRFSPRRPSSRAARPGRRRRRRDLVRVRVEARIARLARAVGEVGEAGLAAAERVRDTGVRRARDDVARPHRDLLVAEEEHAVARRGPRRSPPPCEWQCFGTESFPGDDLDVLEAGRDRADRLAEVAPCALDARAGSSRPARHRARLTIVDGRGLGLRELGRAELRLAHELDGQAVRWSLRRVST